METRYTIVDGELRHYGVLGMKWGVRKGRVKESYAKASKKLAKLDQSAQKKLAKASRLTTKADTKFLFRTSYQDMADSARRKAFNTARKAKKWVDSMEDTFKDTPIKITNDQINIGKKYAELIDMRVAMNQYRRK